MSEWKPPKGLKELYWEQIIHPTQEIEEMSPKMQKAYFNQRVQAMLSIGNIQLHYPNMDRATKKRADKTMRELTELYNLEALI